MMMSSIDTRPFCRMSAHFRINQQQDEKTQQKYSHEAGACSLDFYHSSSPGGQSSIYYYMAPNRIYNRFYGMTGTRPAVLLCCSELRQYGIMKGHIGSTKWPEKSIRATTACPYEI